MNEKGELYTKILENYCDLVRKGWTLKEIKKELLGEDGYNVTERKFSWIIKNRG